MPCLVSAVVMFKVTHGNLICRHYTLMAATVPGLVLWRRHYHLKAMLEEHTNLYSHTTLASSSLAHHNRMANTHTTNSTDHIKC